MGGFQLKYHVSMEKIYEPGTARFGNFINYYEFNPPERRIKLIPKDLLKGAVKKHLFILDVGCNAGNLTEALYEHVVGGVHADIVLHILGVDLDPALIARCVAHSHHSATITYLHADITTRAGSALVRQYLSERGAARFDLVTCFSVTMWIHLHHGDAGLRRFLRIMATLCGGGGSHGRDGDGKEMAASAEKNDGSDCDGCEDEEAGRAMDVGNADCSNSRFKEVGDGLKGASESGGGDIDRIASSSSLTNTGDEDGVAGDASGLLQSDEGGYVCDASGLLLVEPQPWSCYRTAARRMRKLEWRGDVTERIT